MEFSSLGPAYPLFQTQGSYGESLAHKPKVTTTTGMWQEINNEFLISNKFELATFRAPGKLNSRLASWDPNEKSLRWYRTFLNLAYLTSSVSVKKSLQNSSLKTSLGNPVSNEYISSTYETFSINLDYLLAFEELEYLEDFIVEISNIKSIIEIGAGFGRTAHVLIERILELDYYVIFDLPEMLEVSSTYLKSVLSKNNFDKITFTSDINFETMTGFDLGIQIDGFQEMNTESIDLTYSRFLDVAKYVYLKNPIGKYLPSFAGLDVEPQNAPLTLGRSLQVLDIWNLSELDSRYKEHLEIYRPNSHRILNSTPDRLFPHYLHALYLMS